MYNQAMYVTVWMPYTTLCAPTKTKPQMTILHGKTDPVVLKD